MEAKRPTSAIMVGKKAVLLVRHNKLFSHSPSFICVKKNVIFVMKTISHDFSRRFLVLTNLKKPFIYSIIKHLENERICVYSIKI